MEDQLLIGIKDKKIEVLGRGGQYNMIFLAKRKKKENPSAFDKYIIITGVVVNV